MKKKYIVNGDSAIVKGFNVNDDHPDSDDDQSDQTIEESDENTEKEEIKTPEEEVDLDEWTFFNQSDDYVSKVLKEMENTEQEKS